MSRTRILVVEDETIVALDVKERLTELGYEVTGVAERGDQALDLVNATRPDLVLMDIRLKGEMDGITAAEEIRQRWRIPVIYLTAFSEDPTFQRAKVTEPFGYIIKPVEDREIQWAIEMALYKHQAEQRLRESEARYRSLFEANPYPMWVYDLESLAFLAVNDAAVAHYGYGREEFLAMTIADIRPLEENPQLMESVGRVGDRPLNSKDIWRHRQKEGSIIDVEITSHILDYQGRRAKLVLANDVTDRLAIETALQNREKELTLLTDNMIDMISYIDQDRIIRYVSPSIRFVLGYEPLELIGQTALDLVHPDDRDRLLQEAGRALAEKALTLKLEYRYRRAAGDYLWLESLCRFMRDDQGQLQGTVFSTRDISARRQAEEDLRRSEARYRLLAENTSDVVWLLDLTSGRFEYVSPSVERLRGFSAEEVMAQSIAEVMTPDSFRKTVEPLPARLAAFAAGDESMRTQVIEVDQPCKNGRVITVEILTALITGEDGQVAKIAGSSRDITQRKKLEAALRVKDERLQKLVQNMPALLIAWDRDGRLVARNREWSQVTGYQPEEIPFLGDLLESMYPDPVYRASIMEEWRRRGNFFRDWESELTAKDGTKRSVSWSSIADQFPVPGWDSWAIGVDLTDRRMAEEALRKSRDELEVRVKERTLELEAVNTSLQQEIHERIQAREEVVLKAEELKKSQTRLQSVFDGITDPLVMLDQDLKVIMLNRAAQAYFGNNNIPEVIEHPSFEAYGDNGRLCPDGQMEQAVSSGLPFQYERTGLMDPNRWENLMLYPLREEEEGFKGAILRIADITEKKMAENQLIQRQKMEALGILISGIAHEINNPNNFISFNMPILQDYLSALLSLTDETALARPELVFFGMTYPEFREDVFRLLENVRNGSERINAIVSQLKTFSRKKGGLELRETDLGEVVDRVFALSKNQLKKTVHSLEVDIADNLPSVRTDPEALGQVLLNLLINGAQAADKPDSWVKVTVDQRADAPKLLIIEVSDNGCGMEAEILGRIFNPFFTTKKVGEGTGLGLYVCQNLVENLGGRIEVESQPGTGSRFQVFLPLE